MSSINARLSWDRLVDDNKQRIDSFRTQNALATNLESLVQAFASNCEGKPTSKLELAVWKSKLGTSYKHISDLVQNAIISSDRIDSLRPKLSPQIWEVGSLLLEVRVLGYPWVIVQRLICESERLNIASGRKISWT